MRNSEAAYWDNQMQILKERLNDPNSYENNWDYYD